MSFRKIFKRWGAKTKVSEAPIRENLDIIMNVLECSSGIDRGVGGGTTHGLGWSFGNGDSSGGALPEGFEERENTIIDIKWDADYTKIQIKRGTVLVKDAEEEWTDLITYTPFND